VSEHRDIDARRVLLVAGGVVALMMFALVTMYWLLGHFERRQTLARPPVHALVATEAPREPPAPRLQEHPIADLQALRSRENAQLEGYGWVDQAAGRVHIPIERAMELVAKDAAP
jgi:hypothetical protein